MRTSGVAALLLWLSILSACAPRSAPLPTVDAPRYPEFVAPAIPPELAAERLRNYQERAWTFLQAGDLRNAASREAAFQKAWPDEIYNLGGQVFVPTSWEIPDERFDINVAGPSRLLRPIEQRKPEVRLYQAPSSEMLGNVGGLCNEDTPLAPTSPYGVSKMAAHRLIHVCRARKLFVVGGILFNHEPPRRAPRW